MYMEILNRLDTLNTKIDICCGNYDKAAENIQRTYRGFTSRRNTRRTMKPNITESLLNMPGDISQMITDRVSELKPKETIGWTIFKNADGFNGVPGPNDSLIHQQIIKIKNIQDRKKFIIKNGYYGFFIHPSDTILRWGWVRDQAKDVNDLIYHLTPRNNSNGYVVPGASLELIKQKINEGFEVEFEDERDKIAMDKLKHNEMPITDIIVPIGKYEGQYLHDALFSILNSDREYDILPWTQRVLLGEDAKLFAEEYKKWYFNTYKKGGKKRSKTKKKRSKTKKKCSKTY